MSDRIEGGRKMKAGKQYFFCVFCIIFFFWLKVPFENYQW